MQPDLDPVPEPSDLTPDRPPEDDARTWTAGGLILRANDTAAAFDRLYGNRLRVPQLLRELARRYGATLDKSGD